MPLAATIAAAVALGTQAVSLSVGLVTSASATVRRLGSARAAVLSVIRTCCQQAQMAAWVAANAVKAMLPWAPRMRLASARRRLADWLAPRPTLNDAATHVVELELEPNPLWPVPRYAKSLFWEDLSESERSAARVLFYDQVGWDDQFARYEIRFRRWDELSLEQRCAAFRLGYFQAAWDAEIADEPAN